MSGEHSKGRTLAEAILDALRRDYHRKLCTLLGLLYDALKSLERGDALQAKAAIDTAIWVIREQFVTDPGFFDECSVAEALGWKVGD